MTAKHRGVTSPITVLLVDDQPDFLQFVESVLTAHPGLEIVGTATDARDALAKVIALEPQLVILDVQMPEIDGFEAAPMLLEASAGTRVLMTSASPDPAYPTMAYQVGAVGFLNKRRLRPEAVLEVLAGLDRAA